MYGFNSPLCELLQAPCDALGRPAEQLRRWIGIRSLQQRPRLGPHPIPPAPPQPPPPAPRRLDGVRGSRAAYDTATQTLVVFDQRQQRLAFVPLDRANAAAAAAAHHSRWPADGGGAWREVPVPPMPPPQLKLRQRQARELTGGLGGPAADDDGGAAAAGAAGSADEPEPAGEPPPPATSGEEATPEEVADLGGSGLDVLVSCLGGSDGAGEACGGGGGRGATCTRRLAPGSGYVASGHPDGRVLVWDVSRAAAVGCLPSIQGCGRGPVLALAAAAMPPRGSCAADGESGDDDDDGDTEVTVSAGSTRNQAAGPGASVAADAGSSSRLRKRHTWFAVAYREEVLVWSAPLPPLPAAPAINSAATSGVCSALLDTADAVAPLPHARLEAIIKPTLDTAVRSMALSGRHGVLALRSADGVELRSVRRADAGRWLHGFRDRRNTAVMVLGELLFVAASNPAFMMASAGPPPAAPPPFAALEGEGASGPAAAAAAAMQVLEEAEAAARPLGAAAAGGGTSAGAAAGAAAAWTCDFQVEVSAVDLGALVARCGGGGGGGGSGGGGSDIGSGSEAAAAPAAGGRQAELRAVGAGAGAGAGRSTTTPPTAAEPGARPVVVRTTSPAQRCRLTPAEAGRILWDQPLQVCATGGFLMVRCLQFDAAPPPHVQHQQPANQAAQLLWPGLFAFPMGDLVAGLQLTGGAPQSQRQHQPQQRSQQRDAGRHEGALAEETRRAAARSLSARDTMRSVAPDGPVQSAEYQLPASAAAVMRQAGAFSVSGAAAAHRLGTDRGHAEAGEPPHVPAAAPSSPPPRPPVSSTAGVVISRTLKPCVFMCNRMHGSGRSSTGSAAANRLPPSLQLLAAPRCLALVTPGHEVWLQPVPYAHPQRDEE
ncbi:hypothetical protein HYH02_001315 [Chlamydomonas schloesseri]|uniref:Uncharacterized protein n=1 Tax=Chlamydomonas schloesseri TaxID=2026947 RepID=A0A836BD02_9CHLO|nr:hypothetical protein HYH02_001315 [Chlamydomonas schloesseri]|eukprot:KAG2454284.1 hypothetical protein HYH02_001315 [Chlamydomonas schloesseri]